MGRLLRILLATSAATWFTTALPAHAASTTAVVVSACGTPPHTYTVGGFEVITQDTTGTQCTTSGGGGGGGAVTMASGAVASGAYASGSIASGAFASGSVSAGAMVDIGTGASPGANTVNGRLSTINTSLGTINTTLGTPFQAGGALGAGSAKIGQADVDGFTASGASATENPLLGGGRAATAAPTAVADGQKVALQLTPEGASVTRPYAIKEIQVRGTASGTDNAAHTIIASAGGSLKNYITDLECYNTSAVTITITMSDSASSVFIVPAGGGFMKTFNVPLATAAATAFTFTASTGETTIGCSAQGFTGL
jgi:hypothetical protein